MIFLLDLALTNAFMATIFGGVAFVIGGVCRRPALSHWLWVLVLLELITPPTIRLPIPSMTAFIRCCQPQWRTDNGLIVTADFGPIGQTSNGAFPTGPLKSDFQSGDAFPRVLIRDPISEAVTSLANVAWVPCISSIWLAGSVVWFGTAWLRIQRFRRFLRLASPASPELQRRANDLASRLGIKRCPDVAIVPLPISPLLWGIGSDVRVILPAHLLQCLDAEEQDSLLAHELAHLRRHDNWIRLLEMTAIGLFWWHPVAWWARREIGQAEEHCCDSWVVSLLPDAALAYAKTLLKTVEFVSSGRPFSIPVTSAAGQVPILRRRVTLILNESRCHQVSGPVQVTTILIGLFLLTIAPGNDVARGHDESPVAHDVSAATRIDVVSRDVADREKQRVEREKAKADAAKVIIDRQAIMAAQMKQQADWEKAKADAAKVIIDRQATIAAQMKLRADREKATADGQRPIF